MKIKEILMGIAIGDSFGAGVEFQDREWIRKHVDFKPFNSEELLLRIQTILTGSCNASDFATCTVSIFSKESTFWASSSKYYKKDRR